MSITDEEELYILQKEQEGKNVGWIRNAIAICPVGQVGFYVDCTVKKSWNSTINWNRAYYFFTYGRGQPPTRWNSIRDVDGDLYEQMREGMRNSHSRTFDMGFILTGVYRVVSLKSSFVAEKLYVTTWREARDEKILADYFFGQDELLLTLGGKTNSRCRYSGDYYDFVNSMFTLEERAAQYIDVMSVTNKSLPSSQNSYQDYKYNVDLTLLQAVRYKEILKEVPYHLDIVSDGAGTLSLACLEMGKKYSSEEPNAIGRVAKSLGIIGGTFDRDKHVLVVANALYDGNINLIRKYSKVVVIEEGIDTFIKPEWGLNLVVNTTGRVWSKGLDFKYVNNMYRNVVRYIASKAPVKPLDQRSAHFALENGIAVDMDDGYTISVEGIQDSYSIKMRNVPSNLKYAKLGDVKSVEESKFIYSAQGMTVVGDTCGFKYFPRDVKMREMLYPSEYIKEGQNYKAKVRNPKTIKFICDAGMIFTAYFLNAMMEKDEMWSYYSVTGFNVRIKTGIGTSNFIVKENLN